MFSSFKRHPSTTITAFFAVIAGLTPVVSDLADSGTPLGISPVVYGYIFAALAVLGVFGQMWQAIYPSLQSVTWRWPSILGFGLAAITTLTPYGAQLMDAAAPFHLPPTYWAVAGTVILAVSHLGRVLQAVSPSFGQTGATPPQDYSGEEG